MALAALVLLTGQASYAAGPPRIGAPSTPLVSAGLDFATSAYADPWDFSNSSDVPAYNGATMRGGVLRWTATPAYRAELLYYMPGSQAYGRQGQVNPIDAAVFNRISVRLYSSVAGHVGVVWAKCHWSQAGCVGARAFKVTPGWHTYNLPLLANGSAAAPWSGKIIGLRFNNHNVAGARMALDWVRVHRAGPAVTVPWTDPAPGGRATLYWDGDADPGNNTAGNLNWGELSTVAKTGANNSLTFHSGAWPPGTYRFYVSTAAGRSAYSTPVVVTPRPQPRVDSPAPGAGADYASTVVRNPWDFSQQTDGRVANARVVGWRAGTLTATNTGANRDPYVALPVPAPIDGNRYHWLRFRLWYDGPFSLGSGRGGGAVARLIWQVQGSTAWQATNDLVVFPGWNDVALDLRTSPSSAIVEPSQAERRIGWSGHRIVTVQLHPNEDIGARRWRVDDVRLTDDQVSRGAFPIRYTDTSGQSGTVADIYADTNASGRGGRLIASGLPVRSGTNTFTWRPSALVPAGRWWVYVVMRRGSESSVAYSKAPVRLTR